MRFQTLLLSSIASVAAVGVAYAADLPSKKSAPVAYVRTCSIGEVTGFVIPGSDTCLRVGGRIRAEYFYNQPFARSDNTTSTRARAYLTLDAITNSEWGPVRATTRLYATRDSGSSASPTVDWAYIQFNGVTAGRLPVSFFEFAPFGGVSFVGGDTLGRGSDYGSINALAYSFTAGNLTATLALEDGTERRGGLQRMNGVTLDGTAPTYGGHVMPDIVGRLDYTDAWGQVALSGAVHQSRVGAGSTASNVFGTTLGDTAYGYAVQAGVKVNLPMLAPGDALFLQAAYADGANSYTGWSGGAGTVSPTFADVIYDAAGNAKTSTSWSLTGGVLHYWTPSVRQGVFGAWGKIDQYGTRYDAAALSAGTNVIWSPVKNLDIGAEIVYSRLTSVPKAQLPLAAADERDNWSGRLRFERDF